MPLHHMLTLSQCYQFFHRLDFTNYCFHSYYVLYFDKSSYKLVHQVLQQIYQEHQPHFKSEVPLFTLQLAPGLALAEEPDQKFAERESFGMNRCQIIANGLLEAWNQGKNSLDEKMQAIFEQFVLSGIDLSRTYLNADSEDIYLRLR